MYNVIHFSLLHIQHGLIKQCLREGGKGVRVGGGVGWGATHLLYTQKLETDSYAYTHSHLYTKFTQYIYIYTCISIQVHMVCSHQRLLPLTYQHVLKNDIHDKGRIKEKLGSRGGG